jgi:hypothetical protein
MKIILTTIFFWDKIIKLKIVGPNFLREKTLEWSKINFIYFFIVLSFLDIVSSHT